MALAVVGEYGEVILREGKVHHALTIQEDRPDLESVTIRFNLGELRDLRDVLDAFIFRQEVKEDGGS